jgi:hypothetical protein
MRVFPGINCKPVNATTERRCHSDIVGIAGMIKPLARQITCEQVTGCGTHVFKAKPTSYEGLHGQTSYDRV